MSVAGGEQRALGEHRQQQLGTLGQLLDVEIAAVLARRQGAQAFEAAAPARHRAGLARRYDKAAGIERALLALGPFLELLRRRRGSGDSHKGGAGNANAGELGGRRPAVADFPLHHERRGHHVAEKAQARNDGAERGRLREDVNEFDFEHVAGLGALD
jgi:hypothetical protein